MNPAIALWLWKETDQVFAPAISLVFGALWRAVALVVIKNIKQKT